MQRKKDGHPLTQGEPPFLDVKYARCKNREFYRTLSKNCLARSDFGVEKNT